MTGVAGIQGSSADWHAPSRQDDLPETADGIRAPLRHSGPPAGSASGQNRAGAFLAALPAAGAGRRDPVRARIISLPQAFGRCERGTGAVLSDGIAILSSHAGWHGVAGRPYRHSRNILTIAPRAAIPGKAAPALRSGITAATTRPVGPEPGGVVCADLARLLPSPRPVAEKSHGVLLGDILRLLRAELPGARRAASEKHRKRGLVLEIPPLSGGPYCPGAEPDRSRTRRRSAHDLSLPIWAI